MGMDLHGSPACRTGGWTAEAIAGAWPSPVGQEPGTCGVELPP